ncbi:unnamed protein product [Trichobilharzia regenti]|nr:unnamed protein product [Trichobilharzia regenti]
MDVTDPPTSSMLPLSVLTGGSNSTGATYVSTDLIAEMASCPQHSYLFRQPTSTSSNVVSSTSSSISSSMPTSKLSEVSITTSTNAGSINRLTISSTAGSSSASSLQTVVGVDEINPTPGKKSDDIVLMGKTISQTSKDNKNKACNDNDDNDDGRRKMNSSEEHSSTSTSQKVSKLFRLVLVLK